MPRMLLGLALSAVLASAALAEPPNRSSAPSNEFRFVGFTDDAANALPDTIDGGQGMLAMHTLCQDDFGENARMCTSEEFWLSTNAEAPAANSWLHSVPGVIGGQDFIGANAGSCGGWTDTLSVGKLGQVVDTDGKPGLGVAAAGCAIARPVTCCAPIQ